ncbi:hypothetical protein Vafri_9338 [Volvox africanus]|uniref:Uncharacterized protein n=1 Tax=Volvox africanus TaxID=51714 RepID=A0A8J4B5I3_9CHLO|nr:hypothetical protein Vafri_9338 [Volvox africanus]
MHQQQPAQSQSQSQPRLQAQALAALGQTPGGQGGAVTFGIQRRCVQSSSSGAFASQHQHQPPGVRAGSHNPHAMCASQQQPYLPMAGMAGGNGAPGLRGPGPQQLLAPHHLVLAPITEDDCSPQKQLHPGQSAQYGEPYWIPEHPGPSSEAHGAVAPLRLGGFAGGSSNTENVQHRQLHQRGFVPNRYQQQPHHHHLRQNPYQKAVGRGGYSGGSAYGSTYSSVYDDGAYSDSRSSCSSGEMYRSIASLARNTVDGDDDFGDDRLREVEESYDHNEDASQLPVLPPTQHRQRRQQLPPPESYNSGARGGRPNSRLEMAPSNITAAAVRAHDDDDDDDDDDSCSSSGSLESAFITKCLTYTRNSLDIRGRAGGGGASAAAAASAASAAALAAAAAAAGGMSRLSRADRQLYSSAIQTLRANVLNTANGNSAAITATLTTGAAVTGMTLDTAAGVAGSPADANVRPDFDLIDTEADVMYEDIERRDDGYFDVGPGGLHGRGTSRGGGDPTATPTSATVLASSTNASSLGSVEDMLAAIAMLQGGGAGVGSSGPAQEATWR